MNQNQRALVMMQLIHEGRGLIEVRVFERSSKVREAAMVGQRCASEVSSPEGVDWYRQ